MGNKSSTKKVQAAVRPQGVMTSDWAKLQALARTSRFDIKDVRKLHERFKVLAQASPNPDEINQAQWKKIAVEVGIDGADIYLDGLWNAFDDNQSNTIGFREFILGVSAICRGTAREKVELSFEVYDTKGNGRITREEMVELLHKMDSHGLEYVDATTGDGESKEAKQKRSARHEAIIKYVDDVFEEHDVSRNGSLDIGEYTQAVLNHPSLLSYRADTNVLIPRNEATPRIELGESEPEQPETLIDRPCENCAFRDTNEVALLSLISDMKSRIADQQRKLKELEWERNNNSQLVELDKQLKRLRAAPIEGGLQGYIKYGVDKGYIFYDQPSRTIVMN